MYGGSPIPPTRTLGGLAMVVGLFIGGCGALPTAGPTARQIVSQQADEKQAAFDIVDIDDRVIDGLLAARRASLRDRFPTHGLPPELRIGIGDSLVVTVWEA